MIYSETPFWANQYLLTEKCPKCVIETFVHHINKYAIEKWCLNCGYFTYSWLDCCNKPDPIKVIYYMKNGKPSVREQCLNCGKLLFGKAISFKSVDQESLRYFDDLARLNRNNELAFQKKDYEKKKKFNFLVRYEKGYINYLKSDKWKNLRLKILERDNYICQNCKTNKACHVHHLTYDRIGRENLEDLIAICLDCHIKEHLD